MRGAEHDKLWNQLEAEIHLHRHKTVIRACRGRNNRKKKLPLPEGHVSNVFIHENYRTLLVSLVHTLFSIGSFMIFIAHENAIVSNTLMLRQFRGTFLSNFLSHFFTNMYNMQSNFSDCSLMILLVLKLQIYNDVIINVHYYINKS